MADSDSERGAQIHENQPFDESLEVPDSEEVASVYTPSPRIPAPGNQGRSRGETPPDSTMSGTYEEDHQDEYDDDIITPGQHVDHGDELALGYQALYQMHGMPSFPANLSEATKLSFLKLFSNHYTKPNSIYILDELPKRTGHSGGQAPGQRQMFGDDEDDEDSEESDDDDDDSGQQIEGAYNPADYEHLDVQPEIKELFQYITRYSPQTIELEHKLKPFIPDYLPAVGDIDAFIKVTRPDEKPEHLGLYVLDEPCAKQSDPTVLDLQLRAISKQTTHKAMTVRSIEEAEKKPKDVEKWISSISDLHRSKPPPTVLYQKNMPEIDTLMQEWPPAMEEMLKEVGLPTADLDCDLSQYTDMVCALLDVPVHKSRVQSLHVIFTLFSEFKNSQHFRSLADSNQLDNALKTDAAGNEAGADSLLL